MTQSAFRISRSTMTLAAVAALGLGSYAVARNAESLAGMFAPPAPVIVTIDMQKIFGGLTERMARQQELETMGGTMQKELDDLLAAGKSEAQKAEVMADGPEKAMAIDRLTEMQMQVRMKKELFEAKLDQRRADTFRILHAKISDACRRLAAQNKYTLVLTNDETNAIPGGMNTADTQKAISSKRIMFAEAGHDISNELVTFMNNEYSAAGGRAPVAPPAATPVPAPAPAAAPAATPAAAPVK
jgi:Skp family chaperone for outer membrane proteins